MWAPFTHEVLVRCYLRYHVISGDDRLQISPRPSVFPSTETSQRPVPWFVFLACVCFHPFVIMRAPPCKKEGLALWSVSTETPQECDDVAAFSGVRQIERMRRVGAAA